MIRSLNEKKNMLFEGNRLKDELYAAKSMIKSLGLGYQKIDICPNFCILYYNEYTNFMQHKTCQHAWYKSNSGRAKILIAYKKLRYFSITSRLQRLFMSTKTIEYMTWHDMISFTWWSGWSHSAPFFMIKLRNGSIGWHYEFLTEL